MQSQRMDQKTRDAYVANAHAYSEDWLSQPEPSDMYQLLTKYFKSGGKTADVGCGNGRDSHWMARNGFEVTGYDSSTELLKLANKHFPEVSFKQAFLPELKEVQGPFDNVLCETVIMHLPMVEIIPALDNLKRILRPDGVLYLSWRVTDGEDIRHSDGRLYSAFQPKIILDQFPERTRLHFEDKISTSSGKRVCRLICKKF